MCGGGGSLCINSSPCYFFFIFSSVGMMNGQEETVWENVASSQFHLCYCKHVAIQ